jgi:hypothetical protein
MRVGLYLLAIALLVGGCASNPPVSEPIAWETVSSDVPEGMAQLYVVRPEAFAGSANRYLIQLNGLEIGSVRTGYYIVHQATAGDVTISAKTEASILNFGLALAFMGESEVQFRAEPSGVYFVRVDVGFSGGPKLLVVDASTGKQLVNAAQKEPPPEPTK